MKVRAIITLFISLCMAGLAAMVANSWISQRLGAVEQKDQAGQVVVATADLPVGTKLDATHLKVIPLPREAISAGNLTSLDDVIGRVVTQPLYSGEILLEKRLTLHEGGSPLAVVIESGKRALTVRVNDVIGVAGFLLPGSRVDVVSTKRGSGNRSTVSKTIVENLKVLAVDQTVSSDKNDPVIVRAVTLEVTPKQAELVVKATEEGKVQLTLRNPLDMAMRDLGTDQTKAVRPVSKRRSYGYRVDVIKGIKKSRILVTK
ncbi:MAG: Flp pilus assembly protein CpaB [Candidatus Thiodiazotropha sp. (ex Dulcina madagascariensis)]|nr:Flp pilus assembly protein CpaB [Candidatus Thiodiazotropha sp. (ex Dulcina madagascariensis)]